jgi:hypothetical protein
MFETLGQYAQRQDFRSRHRLSSRCAVRKNTRQFRDLREPPAVLFAFVLDREIHTPPLTVAPILTGSVLATQPGLIARNLGFQSPIVRRGTWNLKAVNGLESDAR